MSESFLTMITKDGMARISLLRMPSNQDQWGFFGSDCHGAMEAIENDRNIRVVLLAGASNDAMAMSLEGFGGGASMRGYPSISPAPITSRLDRLDRPLIGLFEGPVSGAGLELALCCDVRIATPAAVFHMDHVRHGLMPWEGGTQRLTRMIGSGAALEMMLLAETVDAAEAHRVGLVHRLLEPTEDAHQYIDTLMRKMVRNSPLSMAYAKEAIKSGAEMTLDQGLRLEADLYFLMHTTGDRSEGIEAFLEKRPPDFRGA